ncbi:U4/U6.U5 tri-snRNP-associated protein 1-like [Oscarella lobularis]|uniref:U4/U6.U5 tri-snRNP-associated protein 1-like n=1 Tax=Oscarella lobularis TaxID=121494 RepID=UPI00331428D3
MGKSKDRSAATQPEAMEEDPEPVPKSSGGDMSLSIEETNKLREKLGLKPLDVSEPGSEEKSASKKKEDVFVPTENIGEKKREEKMRRKLADFKESRVIKEKLGNVKGLGDGEAESASDWVTKLRKIQEEKKLAEKRAKLLDELDEVDEEQDYNAQDLKGLKVEHDQEKFQEGRSVVLTLKDSDVLDVGGDVLVNVNMVDEEKVAKNLERKKGKPAYNPYEDEEVDEDGVLKEKILLKKYDEVENPEEPKSFQLGAGGNIDMEEIERKKKFRKMLKLRGESLDYKSGQVASEYYSQEEMVRFKRPKKKKKEKRKRSERETDAKAKVKKEEDRDEIFSIRRNDDDDGIVLSEDDEAEAELQKALERSRRLQTRKDEGIKNVEEILAKVTSLKKEPVDEKPTSGKIELSSIAEFCRTVGETSSQEDSRPRPVKIEEEKMEVEYSESWEEAIEESSQDDKKEDHATSAGFEAEPVVGSSIGAALQIASRKGLIDAPEQKKKFDKKFEFVERDSAKHVVVEASTEAMFQREFRDRRGDRFDGGSFREKSDYKPKVNIKYINDKGDEMTPKEAFRFMSHKFHGKNPGKLKLEKRSKKKQDTEMLKKMSCTDTPLNTVAMMQEKQKQSHAPFVVLSGGARKFASLPPVVKK